MPVLTPEAFVGALRERGFSFFAGVPCSILKRVIAYLDEQDDVPYVPATREDSALGMAAGLAMGGKRAVVMMQNSGLGLSINALVSLFQIYELPCLLVITWRGYGGKDAPEHVIMGPALPSLLDLFHIPHRTLEPDGSADDIVDAIDWASRTLEETSLPCALLVRKGAL